MHYVIHNTVRFDTDEYTLERIHEPHTTVTLTVTMSRLLLFLIENHGSNVTKDDILSQVWEAHGLRASTNSLNKYISDLRQMFRTLDVEDEVIITIPRVGFSIPGTLNITASVIAEEQNDSVALVDSKSSAKSREEKFAALRYTLLFIIFLIVVGLVFHISYPQKNNSEDVYTAIQKTYPVGMIDNCPVVALKPIAENMKPRNIEIAQDILKKLSITCEEESLYYIRFSDDVIYHQPGRVFLADCSIRDRSSGSLSSCYNYYGADYETNAEK